MNKCHELEASVVRNLALRGLTPVANRFAFAHKGEVVDLAIEQSVYSGFFIVVRERNRKVRHFRARAGSYDWNAIAAFVVETAESRAGGARASAKPTSVQDSNQRLARDLASIVNAGSGAPLAIEASAHAPGRVRVKMHEVELDPISVMRLYELVRNAQPPAPPSTGGEAVSVL